MFAIDNEKRLYLPCNRPKTRTGLAAPHAVAGGRGYASAIESVHFPPPWPRRPAVSAATRTRPPSAE
jgi:hypothetical protein